MADHLPTSCARCEPIGCRQADRCARATDWPTGDDIELQIVDASVCLTTDRGVWCPMFIDRRGLALLEPV
jgi:hypothetical protein